MLSTFLLTKLFVHAPGWHRIVPVCGFFFLLGFFPTISLAKDPFGKSNQPSHLQLAPEIMAFDQVNWNRPQGVFSWITMARGYETPWDSSNRPGWMTTDPFITPIDPGISKFSVHTEIFYIVFEGQPLDAPGQFAAAWYEIKDGQVNAQNPIGKDVIELEMNQRFGFLEIYQPKAGWKPGDYQIKIYYGSPGQKLHAVNVIGTMKFSISP